MNVLFLVRLYWPHGGGVEKHVEKLSERLIARGHKVTIITEQYEQDIPEFEIYSQVKIYRIPYFALQSKLSLWAWMENHLHLFDDADVIHVHDVFWWYWPIYWLRLFKPVYITFHGYEGSEPPTKKAIFWRKAAELVCKKTICIGAFMKKWYWANPYEILYGAADLSPLPLPAKNSAVFWGRFDEDAGPLVYAEAVKKMRLLSGLSFYGKGSQMLQLNKLALDDNRIELHSWKKNISNILIRHRYAFVSRYLSILEAMQAGRLVFAVYNNQIKRDYLMCHPMRDNMVIAGSSVELANKFNSIVEKEEEQKIMIAQAQEWAMKQRWEMICDVYLRLWGAR